MGLGVTSSYIFMGSQLTHPTSLWVVSWLILGHFHLPALNLLFIMYFKSSLQWHVHIALTMEVCPPVVSEAG